MATTGTEEDQDKNRSELGEAIRNFARASKILASETVAALEAGEQIHASQTTHRLKPSERNPLPDQDQAASVDVSGAAAVTAKPAVNGDSAEELAQAVSVSAKPGIHPESDVTQAAAASVEPAARTEASAVLSEGTATEAVASDAARTGASVDAAADRLATFKGVARSVGRGAMIVGTLPAAVETVDDLRRGDYEGAAKTSIGTAANIGFAWAASETAMTGAAMVSGPASVVTVPAAGLVAGVVAGVVGKEAAEQAVEGVVNAGKAIANSKVGHDAVEVASSYGDVLRDGFNMLRNSSAVHAVEHWGGEASDGAKHLGHEAVEGAEHAAATVEHAAERVIHTAPAQAIIGAAEAVAHSESVQAVVHGAQAVGEGVVHGAEAVGEGMLHGAEVAGHAVYQGLDSAIKGNTGQTVLHGIGHGAAVAAHGLEVAANAVDGGIHQGMHFVGEKVGNAVDAVRSANGAVLHAGEKVVDHIANGSVGKAVGERVHQAEHVVSHAAEAVAHSVGHAVANSAVRRAAAEVEHQVESKVHDAVSAIDKNQLGHDALHAAAATGTMIADTGHAMMDGLKSFGNWLVHNDDQAAHLEKTHQDLHQTFQNRAGVHDIAATYHEQIGNAHDLRQTGHEMGMDPHHVETQYRSAVHAAQHEATESLANRQQLQHSLHDHAASEQQSTGISR